MATPDAQLKQLESYLTKLFGKMKDLSPVMDELEDIGIESIHRNFDEGGRTGTGMLGGGTQKWKPSARGGKTLLNNGQLRDSIHASHDKTSMTFATAWKSAAAHNFGAVIKPKKGKYLIFSIGTAKIFALMVTLPKREFMVLQDEDVDDMVDVVMDYYVALSGS
jgi:phage gpG-like protein